MSRKLFKDYEECYNIITIMIKDFSRNQQNTIGLAINVCHSLKDDREKIYRLYTSFKKLLWGIPEAIQIGFNQYMEREILRLREILEYHDENCLSNVECKICEDRIRVLDNIHEAIYYEEGKRPKIYQDCKA